MKSKSFIKLCKGYEIDPDTVPEILSFEDACKDRNVDPLKLPGVAHLPERYQKRILADYKLSVIADALRGGVDVNYNDTDEWKHLPVFEIKADEKRTSGFGLSFIVFDAGWYAFSYVGVRLCFKERDVAVFFGKHFIDLHTDHHLLT